MNIFEYDVACVLCASIDKFCPQGPLSSLIHIIVALRARGASPACNPGSLRDFINDLIFINE